MPSLWEWRDRAEALKVLTRKLIIEKMKMSASSTDDAAIERCLRRYGLSEDVIEWILGSGVDSPPTPEPMTEGIVQ